MSTGMFIAFEGPDGVGKTTTMEGVAQELKKRGYGEDEVIIVQDPGTSQLGMAIRPILKGGEVPMSTETQMLMFIACRMQMAQEIILPALQKGMAVLCDRYLMSTIVYQVLASHKKWENFRELLYRTEFLTPSVYVVLTADYATLRERRLASRWTDYFEPKETIKDIAEAALSGNAEVLKTIINDDDEVDTILGWLENKSTAALRKFEKKPTKVPVEQLEKMLTSKDVPENLFGQWKAILTGQEEQAVDIVADGRFDDDEFQRRVAGCYYAAPSLIPGSEPVLLEDTTGRDQDEIVQSLSDSLMKLKNA